MAEIKKYLDTTALGTLVDQIKAEDAKVLAAANKYTDDAGKLYDGAGSAATAEENAKKYTDEVAATLETKGEAAKVQGNLDTEVQARKDADAGLQGSIDSVSAVANKNKEDIAAINHAETGILAVAKKYTDDEAAKVQKEVDDLEVYVGTFTSENAKTVVEYIDEKTYGIASDAVVNALSDRVTQAEKDIDAIEADYLKAADKTELEGKITSAQTAADNAQDYAEGVAGDLAEAVEKINGAIALKADQTALDAVSGVANAAATKVALEEEVNRAKGEEARIEGLVTAEVERATGVEADFKSRIEAMETFWDVTEDADGVVNKLKEIQDYIASDETGAATMAGNIQKNTQDIAAMDEAYKAADATLQENIDKLSEVVNGKVAQGDFDALEGRMDDAEGAIDAVEGRLDVVEPKVATLEGEMDDVQAAVATKAEAQALADAVSALEGVDAGQETRIAALEAKFGEGEGNVEDMIADAKQEAIDAAAGDATSKANKALEDAKKYADEEDAKIESRVDALESASATHALNSDLTALAGRVTTAEGEIDTLQSEMDAVEELAANNKAAHEANAAEIAKKAAQSDLEAAVARIAQNETAIGTLNTTMGTKADADDLDAAVLRIAANESAIAANTSAINSFTAITPEEVTAMFA